MNFTAADGWFAYTAIALVVLVLFITERLRDWLV